MAVLKRIRVPIIRRIIPSRPEPDATSQHRKSEAADYRKSKRDWEQLDELENLLLKLSQILCYLTREQPRIILTVAGSLYAVTSEAQYGFLASQRCS
jgi:hypothetical protein